MFSLAQLDVHDVCNGLCNVHTAAHNTGVVLREESSRITMGWGDRVDLKRSRIVNIEDVVFMQHLASNPLGLTESCDNYATL